MRVAQIMAIKAAVVTVAFATGAAAECKFAQIAEVRMASATGVPRVTIEVNGRKGELLLNTASAMSTLTQRGAAALGIAIGPQMEGYRLNGLGQEVRYRTATASDVVIGGALRTAKFEFQVPAEMADSGDAGSGDIVGWLGQDYLAASDVEYELSKGVVRFFRPEGCADSDLAYWGGDSSVVDISAPPPGAAYPAFDVFLNEKRVKAGLISGRAASVVDLYAAQAAGVVPGGVGVEAIAQDSDERSATSSWVGRFASVQIGQETIKNVRLAFQDLWSGARVPTTGSRVGAKIEGFPAMMLGNDFLASHRVLIANSQKKMYFSYTGGPPLAAPPRSAASIAPAATPSN